MELTALTLVEAKELVGKGEVTPKELVEAFFE